MDTPQLIFDKLNSFGLPFDIPNKNLKSDYLKFLSLKVFTQDLDGTIISPTIEIDEIWHHHLLYNKHYFDMCSYIQFIIYHWPEREQDFESVKHIRRQKFISLYNKYFSDYKDENTLTQNILTAVFVKTLTNRTITIDVNLEKDTVKNFKYKVYLKEGIDPHVQRYIFHGKILYDDNKLLKEYGVEKDSILHLNLQLKGC
jgi:hypothetical protein